MARSAWTADDSTERRTPVPPQSTQRSMLASARLGRSRWRESSINPKGLIRPMRMRARSIRIASLSLRSTARWLRFSSMSMKSMTISPARSRSRSWRAISSAASRLVLSAVSSIVRSLVARPEFTSIATNASVGLMTRYPPDLSWSSGPYMESSWLSI